MPLSDMSLADLREYAPEREEPADFDEFWAATLKEARAHEGGAVFTPYDAGLVAVEVYDVTFPGFAGDPIKGWFLVPAGATAAGRRLPGVVSYIGYGGGRALPHDWLLLACAGYANLVMDTRGQGSGYQFGDTPDDPHGPIDPAFPGVMTRGVREARTYYYRRLMTDAARAVDALRAHPLVDPDRVAVAGGSQGGGLALAAAGLVPDVSAALIDVPFLCHWRRALDISDAYPYQELVNYLRIQRDRVEETFTTLSYVDGVNHAARARATALFSVALMDGVCPPSTVFAAHHHYAGAKEISVWPYNGHEGGQTHQQREQLAFLARTLGS
ncbi:cephalosporin-C deacetylase [Luedemannella flava]|uniref:Cephalosporin-C deacetylase n=1 Tax=Luedemannella flava TaxID=349316 RepID=A0ABP4YFU7_9ACTN